MSKKKLGTVLCVLLCSIMIFLSFPVTGHAQVKSNDSNDEENASKIEVLDSAEAIYLPKVRGSILQKGYIKIENCGNGKLSIFGYTIAHRNVNTVKVTITLQRQVGSLWQKVTSWTGSKSNNYYVDKSVNYYTTKGYNYRLVGEHYAQNGSTTEKENSVTTGIKLT